MNTRWRRYVKLKQAEIGKEGLFIPCAKRCTVYTHSHPYFAKGMDGFVWTEDLNHLLGDKCKSYSCAYYNDYEVKTFKFRK